MRVWGVVLLLNLALAVGFATGYAVWGRQAGRLAVELAAARVSVAGEREYQAVGVVRAVLPDINLIVITHGEIAGYMPAMTMGFRAASPKILAAVGIGDTVRFTLRGTPPNLAVVDLDKTAP